MIQIQVKDNESVDRALKRFKKKFERAGVVRELRSRQAFEKQSVTRRKEVI
ncbi:MAG: 30S ribosomal protein S21, partial [Spirosomaceae bacterium]|nr:30S ribosomal protein S21 [Spirosomataceae bacterium]